MKFCEAMEMLIIGSKITRALWKNELYFSMDDNKVKTYQNTLKHYQYNEDIMVSDSWLVQGKEEEYKFYEIIPFLQQGKKAKIKDWKDSYIHIDPMENVLILNLVEEIPYMPHVSDFIAEDWIVYDR